MTYARTDEHRAASVREAENNVWEWVFEHADAWLDAGDDLPHELEYVLGIESAKVLEPMWPAVKAYLNARMAAELAPLLARYEGERETGTAMTQTLPQRRTSQTNSVPIWITEVHNRRFPLCQCGGDLERCPNVRSLQQ